MSVPKQVWYTSDLHFLHEKVALIRGFKDSAEHDIAIFENWQGQVTPNDTVYVLGDIASDERTLRHALGMLDALPGDKILIAGNHDGFHPKNRKFMEWQEIALSFPRIKAVAPFARRKLLGKDVMLSHFPYYRERPGVEPRDMQYRLRNEGNWLLHGHTHGTEVVTVQQYGEKLSVEAVNAQDALRKQHASMPSTTITREFHVGLDAHDFKLVNQNDILKVIGG